MSAETHPRILALDGLRGVAVATVVLYHVFYVFAEPRVASPLAYLTAAMRLWWSGVDLFFVLSGFLIGGILLDAKPSPTYYKTFYIRRFYRIFPLYFSLLATYALTSHLLPQGGEVFPAFAYLTLTQNYWAAGAGAFGVIWLSCTWSLAIEEQFYLVTPALVRLTSRRVLSIIVMCAIIAAPLARGWTFFSVRHGPFAAHVLTFTRADVLLYGVGAALIVRNSKLASILANRIAILSIVAILAGTAIAFFTIRDWTIGSLQMVVAGYSIQAIFFTCILLIVVLSEHGWIARLMSSRVLQYLGGRSYAIYLFHVPALYLAFFLARKTDPHIRTWAEMLIAVASAGGTVCLAEVSWRILEKPLLTRAHRYRYIAETLPDAGVALTS